jgi:hypothetical protein
MPFHPSQSAKTKYCWECSAVSGVDGDPITSISEQIGGVAHLAQATSAKKPTLKKALAFFNNKDAALFDGVDDVLQSAAFTALPQPYTRFLVFKFVTLANDTFIADGVASGNRSAVYCSSGGGNPLAFYAGAQILGLGLDTNAHYTTIEANGASSKLYRDGVQSATGDAGAHSITGSTWGAAFATPNGNPGHVYVAEEILTEQLTAGERAKFHDYLAAKYFAAIPAAPSVLTATPFSANRVDVAFTSNSTNEDGFKVERKTGSGGAWAQVGTTTTGTYEDNTVASSTQYYYRVRSYNGNGNSAYSNEDDATTPAAPALAITPTLTTYRATVAPLPLPLPQFTASQSVRWATTHGTLLTSYSPRTLYVAGTYAMSVYLEPANETRLLTLTATNAGNQSTTTTIQVYATIPVIPDFGVAVEEEDPAEVSYAPDKKHFTARYNGEPVEKWELKFVGRKLAERQAMKAFRRFHRLHLPVYLDEQVLGDLILVHFDSGLKTDGNRTNLIDFAVVVKQF